MRSSCLFRGLGVLPGIPYAESVEDNPNAFKLWINADVVEKYARGLRTPALLSLTEHLKPLELRGRVKLLAHGFHEHLKGSFPQKLKSLMSAVQSEKIDGFALWPATEFIQLYGVDHFQESMDALYELTQKFTAEFAVRPFLVQDPKRTFALLKKWVKDPNVHIRRWVSEGTRPRLPWGERLPALIQDPNPSLELLELLRFDSELYVRKSVANHLNDIAKDHPDRIVQTLARWEKDVPDGFEKQFDFIRSRALRTLIKDCHPGALKLMGIQDASKVLEVTALKLAPKVVKLGSKVEFSFVLKNSSSREVRYLIDYAVHHKKADGKHSPKVFKFKSGSIPAASSLLLSKRHSIKPITTRKYYPGTHRIELLLNGKSVANATFRLE
jgi:3-methyladenine DNA glycosylase AlkC